MIFLIGNSTLYIYSYRWLSVFRCRCFHGYTKRTSSLLLQRHRRVDIVLLLCLDEFHATLDDVRQFVEHHLLYAYKQDKRLGRCVIHLHRWDKIHHMYVMHLYRWVESYHRCDIHLFRRDKSHHRCVIHLYRWVKSNHMFVIHLYSRNKCNGRCVTHL